MCMQPHSARARAPAWQEPSGADSVHVHAHAPYQSPLLDGDRATVYFDAVEDLGPRRRKSPSAVHSQCLPCHAIP